MLIKAVLFFLVLLLCFNLFQIENWNLIAAENLIATIGATSCLCGLVLLGLLVVSKKIKKRVEKSK